MSLIILIIMLVLLFCRGIVEEYKSVSRHAEFMAKTDYLDKKF